MGVDRADAAITSKKTVRKCDMLPISQVPVRVTDENVEAELIKKFCTKAGWRAVLEMVTALKRQGKFDCEVCDDSDFTTRRSIVCDCCLNWYHFSCAGLTDTPRTKNWFCRSCSQE